MTWLDTLLSRGNEAKRAVTEVQPDSGEPASAVGHWKGAPRLVIHSVWVQTAAARLPDYPGAAEPAFYVVDKGALILSDENGKPTGKSVPLGQNDDPRRIAGRLWLEAWKEQHDGSDFNRPLHYRPLSIA